MKFKRPLWSYLTPENIGRWLSSFGGRRFLLSLGAGVASSFLVWFEKISDEIYRDVVLATVAAYITGNTFQKIRQTNSQTTVQVAEITGEAPPTVVTPVTVEVTPSAKKEDPIGY